jgi:hypothetical protein
LGKKIKGAVLYSFIIVLLMYVFFSIPSGRETVLRPVWVRDTVKAAVNPNLDEKTCTGFSLGGIFGYVDMKGSFLYKGNIDHNLALSDSGFINFSSVQEANQSLVMNRPNGEFKFSCELSGYPVLDRSGERLFLVKLDNSGIKEINQDGAEAWSQEYTSLLTTFSAARDFSVVGLLNGTIRYYNRNGKSLYKFSPEGSRISVILGSALSNLGDKIGCVAGIDPQQLVIITRTTSDFQKPVITRLASDFRREVMMRFSDDGQFLYVEGEGSLLIVDTKANRTFTIPCDGALNGLQPGRDNRYVFLTTRNRNASSLRFFKPPQFIIAGESYECDNTCIRQLDSHLLLGIDTWLVLLKIEEV